MRALLFYIALSWALLIGTGYEITTHLGDAAAAISAPIVSALHGVAP
jgi:hypothetical protein